MEPQPVRVKSNPGAAPGLEHDEILQAGGSLGPVALTCIDYCPGEVLAQEIHEVADFLARHRPAWSRVRWINVDGLSDMNVIHALATKYELHPLAVEDVLHVTQRPKVEPYGGEDGETLARLFIVARAAQLEGSRVRSEQISIFLGHKTVLTFREGPSDLWEPIRQRIHSKGSRLRACDASFLMYSLLDAIVDRFFPILESFSDFAEDLESGILEHPGSQSINEIHQLKRDLLVLLRVAWPMRVVVSGLHREPHECMSEETRLYMHDLYDHVIQIMDIVEILRESAGDLSDTYMSAASHRMNEIMKVLTIISTIFIPITFLAGVYGMNFPNIPELGKAWGYAAFWMICIATAGVMLAMFRRRRWL